MQILFNHWSNNMKRKGLVIFLLLSFYLTLIPKISLANYDAEKAFTFLEKVFNLHDKKLYDNLLVELNQYLALFPEGESARRAQYMIGKIYEEKRKEDFALAAYLKMLFLLPDSAENAECIDSLMKIINTKKAYEKKKDELLQLFNQGFPKYSSSDGYFAYLKMLLRLEQSKLREWFMEECREFIRRFPDDKRNDGVLLWIAETYSEMRDYREADIAYLKLSTVFPDSQLIPAALYQQGMLLYQKLWDYKQAMNTFQKVSQNYNSSGYAADALYTMGEINEKKHKDYQKAISYYRQVFDKYPTHVKAPEALWSIAQIYKSKLKNYPEAILIFNEVADKYPENPGSIEALEEAGQIYKTKLKDYASAAEIYIKIATLYPVYEKAPLRLFEAGDLYEKKLKDYNKALEKYQEFLEKYSFHQKAKEVPRRIKNIQGKI